jgi:hypothetical protein
MTESSDEIIAEPRARALAAWLGGLAVLWGIAAAVYYSRAGLTLSHYDAKGHLVVARRVFDGLTPGWLQIGAVWLPLPHLLNMLPVQIDALYRTGASGVAISILGFSLLIYSAARFVTALGGSRVVAAAVAILIASNPNLLYLQSTPMTEPLLLGLLALGLTLTYEALNESSRRKLRWASGVLALACLTRYESWPITAAAVVATAVVAWRDTRNLRETAATAAQVALFPVICILWFFVHSKATVGAWFVTEGFYVPDPMYKSKPIDSLGAVWWGTRQLGSEPLAWAGLASLLSLLVLWWRRLVPNATFVAFAWLGASALPFYAFNAGHPLRIRYMVPSVTAAVILCGLALARLPRRWQLAASAALVAGVLLQARPFDPAAPMVLEAQWDLPRAAARHEVTRCLPPAGNGEVIMASMGSLAPYMQELSAVGYSIRDFLHEGNGDLWAGALNGPSRYVRYILIEEVAEGGDMLAEHARADPRFLDGFMRTCSGGGVALYKLENSK